MSKVLSVSRNTVAEVQALFLQSGKSWDDISQWDDDRLYELFYRDKFKYKPRYAPVDHSYVHKELKKTGVTEKLLWEEYCVRCKKEGANACSYITFAKNYKKFTADKNYTSHIEHKPGLEIEVDSMKEILKLRKELEEAKKENLFLKQRHSHLRVALHSLRRKSMRGLSIH